tara:strand:+ start:5797 stop:5943 length:147 start_codon:yes stop_codon:yes gene_type:complete
MRRSAYKAHIDIMKYRPYPFGINIQIPAPLAGCREMELAETGVGFRAY